MILNILAFFQLEKEQVRNGIALQIENVIQRAADATKLSTTTIANIKKNGIKSDQDYAARISSKQKIAKTKMTTYLKHRIRDTIYSMYARKEYVILATRREKFREEIEYFEFSIDSLRRWINSIGFKWKKSNNKKYFMDLPNIVHKRINFLREYIKNRNVGPEGFTPVFIDETWIFSKGSFCSSWQDDTKHTDSRKNSEGHRYIVVHAGTKDGFIKGANSIFKSGLKTGDYHDNMNRKNFENWFKTQLVPNLPPKSFIIMDNASYHSGLLEEIPRKSWTKQRLTEWLKKKNIGFPEKAMKDKIWSIARRNCPSEKKYFLDEYVKPLGHKILRLPPYHCQFNAIEMVWSECKQKYDQYISNFKGSPSEVLTTWERVINEISIDHWQKYVFHTEKVIEKAWEAIQVCDAYDILPLVITTDKDDDDNISDFSSDSDNTDEID
ncbi:uncharacterized protein LOC126742623 [Anthonomus grandis grandis]|uniref:uncharacterized protein LOC126742623 n=1 Tax=Anthonomus grandis grandis TaxID=2921223 RepID=UPI002165C527|nr:uncharacterized protein LOC126742623 [Anthonomus grandis grandis]